MYVQHPGPTALFGLVFLLGLTDGPILNHLTQKIVSFSLKPPPRHTLSLLTSIDKLPPPPHLEISSISEVPPQDLRCLMILDPSSFHQSHAC